MTKRALLAVAGFFGLCLPLSAQQMLSPEQLLFERSSLNGPSFRLPPLTLADRERISFMNAFTWQTPLDFLPPFSPDENSRSVAYADTAGRTDSLERVVEMRARDRVYVGGEIGFLYGKSSGKYGREDFSSYIIGTVGNDKFSITAGVFHQESNGRVPRWGR